MNTIKKFMSMVLVAIMSLGMCFSTFAAPTATTLSYDLDSYDLTTGFTETKKVMDQQGRVVEITNTFTPKEKTRGSSTEDATEGTWESYMNYGLYGMSFTFDLAKNPGGGWTISNAGNLNLYAFVVQVENSSVTIERATSSAASPARVVGKATCTLFDIGWIQLYSGTITLEVRVSHDGKLTTIW